MAGRRYGRYISKDAKKRERVSAGKLRACDLLEYRAPGKEKGQDKLNSDAWVEREIA